MALKKNAIIKESNSGGKRAEYIDNTSSLYDDFMRHQKLCKDFMAPLFKTKCVIEKAIIDEKSLKVKQIFKGVTGNSPLTWGTGVDKEYYEPNEVIAFEIKDNHDIENEKEFYTKACGFYNGKALEYLYFPNIVQVKVADNTTMKNMTLKGFSYKLNEKIVIGKKVEGEGWVYCPGASTTGPNNEKHGNKFFVRNMSNKEGWAIIDGVNGNGYDYYLSQKNLDCKKTLKQSSRLNLFGPSMRTIAKINLKKDYVVYVDCSIDSCSDVDEETEERLNKHGIKLGRNINDGKSYLGAEAVNEATGMPVEDVLTIAPQTRCTLFGIKTLSEMVLSIHLEELVDILEKLFPGHVHIYGNRNGRCLLVVDKDGAKLPNFARLERGKDTIKVYCLNIAKASNSKTSGQLLVKALTRNYDGAIERCKQLIVDAVEEQFLGNHGGSFNPFTGHRAAVQAVLGDKMVLDESHMFNTLHELCNFSRSAIADLKVPVSSVYDHAMFDDSYIWSGGYVRNTLKVRFSEHYNMYFVECYSKDVNVLLEEETNAILCDSTLSETERYEKLIKIRSAVIVKYPSAGADEMLPVYFMTDEELEARKQENVAMMIKAGAAETLVDSYISYLERIAFGITIFAALNFVKAKLAGMDVDFDAILELFDELKEYMLDPENIMTFIDYEALNQALYPYAGDKENRANLKF